MARKPTRSSADESSASEHHQLYLLDFANSGVVEVRDRVSAPAIASAVAAAPREVARTEGVVLVDLENTQPDNLEVLVDLPFRVIVFTGENQAKISLNTAAAMQRMGTRAEYVRMTGKGPNALDFHIAFYAGELASTMPGARFYIVTKDRGFDPLINHLNERFERPVMIKRVRDLTEIPGLPIYRVDRFSALVETAIEKLAQHPGVKPQRLKTLTRSISLALSTQLEPGESKAIVAELVARGIVILEEKRVRYALPRCDVTR